MKYHHKKSPSNSVIHTHLHSCNTLFKSQAPILHNSLFPISVCVSQSCNNIWRYMLAQEREERWGNRYFQNWNWDVLFTAFAIGFKILQFILISTCLNFITPLLSDVISSGILYEHICLYCYKNAGLFTPHGFGQNSVSHLEAFEVWSRTQRRVPFKTFGKLVFLLVDT